MALSTSRSRCDIEIRSFSIPSVGPESGHFNLVKTGHYNFGMTPLAAGLEPSPRGAYHANTDPTI
jgi:hypothetical protein